MHKKQIAEVIPKNSYFLNQSVSLGDWKSGKYLDDVESEVPASSIDLNAGINETLDRTMNSPTMNEEFSLEDYKEGTHLNDVEPEVPASSIDLNAGINETLDRLFTDND